MQLKLWFQMFISDMIWKLLRYNTTQQQPFYGPLSGITQVSWYMKKHSRTHHPDHHPIFISFFHLPRSIASFLFKLRAWQSFSMSSLVYLLVWSPPPHIPYISSPNQCLLFAAHAHTIATKVVIVDKKPPPPQPFYGPLSVTTWVSQCQMRTSGLYGARED